MTPALVSRAAGIGLYVLAVLALGAIAGREITKIYHRATLPVARAPGGGSPTPLPSPGAPNREGTTP